MLKKRLYLVAGIILTFALTACGKNPQVIQFQKDIDSFCVNISTLDTAMNSIDATADTARAELLGYLDDLDKNFQEFAALDFPEEFDYLEPLADEAGTYMTEAVSYYHKTYAEDNVYDDSYVDYAQENYSRAWKRVQIIIAFLHGDTPEDVSLEIE